MHTPFGSPSKKRGSYKTASVEQEPFRSRPPESIERDLEGQELWEVLVEPVVEAGLEYVEDKLWRGTFEDGVRRVRSADFPFSRVGLRGIRRYREDYARRLREKATIGEDGIARPWWRPDGWDIFPWGEVPPQRMVRKPKTFQDATFQTREEIARRTSDARRKKRGRRRPTSRQTNYVYYGGKKSTGAIYPPNPGSNRERGAVRYTSVTR